MIYYSIAMSVASSFLLALSVFNRNTWFSILAAFLFLLACWNAVLFDKRINKIEEEIERLKNGKDLR